MGIVISYKTTHCNNHEKDKYISSGKIIATNRHLTVIVLLEHIDHFHYVYEYHVR